MTLVKVDADSRAYFSMSSGGDLEAEREEVVLVVGPR